MVGAGSSGHLASVRFEQMTGTKVTHVNYKGGGPLTNDLLGGHVNLVFGSFPDLPPANETVPGFELKTWFGLPGPAGLPREVVARLNGEVKRALADPQVKDALVGRGFEIAAGSPEDFAAFLQRESEAAGRVLRRLAGVVRWRRWSRK